MAASAFDQFEAYTAAIHDADLRMMLPRLDAAYWEIDTIPVGDLHVQWGREGSGNITEGSSLPGGQVLFVPFAGLHHVNGMPMHDRSVFLMRPGSEFTISVAEKHEWCSVFIPWRPTDEDSGPLSPGEDPHCRLLDLDPPQDARLRWILTRLARAAALEPRVLKEPSSLRFLQRDLTIVCREASGARPRRDDALGRPRIPRRDVMRTIRDVIERHADEGLTIDDLATAADVSERTLRTLFIEFYGVPPREYLLTHRLHRVREALRKAEPDETTVTAVAAGFGFWHFGRFAGAYRRKFGESPSTTLHADSPMKRRLAVSN